MNYTFNKTLIEQVKAGTHYVDNRNKKPKLFKELFKIIAPKSHIDGSLNYYWADICGFAVFSNEAPTDKTPIPLSNFVQPEQSERDVMAELDKKIAKLEKMGAFEMLDFICSPTMSQRLAKLLNGEFKETPNDHSQLVGEPEPKWTPKVGEWFKEEDDLYYAIQPILDAIITGQDPETGITASWHDIDEVVFTKPTDKEVEDYMVGLAKEKGFIKGAKYKYPSNPNIEVRTILGDTLKYKDYHDQDIQTLQDGYNCIWDSKDGWAEIVNPVRWRAEKGGKYFYIDYDIAVENATEFNDDFDDLAYKTGNYFQTKEQAEEMAVLMQFTLNNPELVKQLMDEKE